ncbi:MAG: hypothetical protein RJA48_1833, partial [Verrucomicrobiota bacterium]
LFRDVVGQLFGGAEEVVSYLG